MPPSKTGTKTGSQATDQVIAEALRNREQREKTYRERALKLFPWVCGRCGREFSGKRVRELTVHHRDHNHDHNPTDGSNWELLCIYCHDNEHARDQVHEWYDEGEGSRKRGVEKPSTTHKAFAGLEALLKNRQ